VANKDACLLACKKVALVNSTTHIQRKLGWDRTVRAWFSHRVQHLARNRHRTILTIHDPAWAEAEALTEDSS